MLISTSDKIAIVFGLASCILTALGIFVTLYLRTGNNNPRDRISEPGIEMQPIIQNANIYTNTAAPANEYEAVLRTLIDGWVFGYFTYSVVT
ncbi:hypothetical protein DL98DRAFT_589701 [Cadophora sp. DSE1049]|nr:hypothetical protein DL98DRAFT_589701 [Cadophora sp. DSE1049]